MYIKKANRITVTGFVFVFSCGCLHDVNILWNLKCCMCEVVSMLPCVQPQSMAEVLAKKEELADRLEKANEEAIASAIAEEEQLTREIQAENNDLETDNESDFSVRLIILILSLLMFGSFLFDSKFVRWHLKKKKTNLYYRQALATEDVESILIGVTCWQIMMVRWSTSKRKLNCRPL